MGENVESVLIYGIVDEQMMYIVLGEQTDGVEEAVVGIDVN